VFIFPLNINKIETIKDFFSERIRNEKYGENNLNLIPKKPRK